MKRFKPKGGKRRRNHGPEARKDDFIYFEEGLVTESLPGANFRVKVNRATKDESKELQPIIIICHLKAKLIKRRIMIIKGDNVTVEVNPIDMYHDEENNILKGTIIERK